MPIHRSLPTQIGIQTLQHSPINEARKSMAIIVPGFWSFSLKHEYDMQYDYMGQVQGTKALAPVSQPLFPELFTDKSV